MVTNLFLAFLFVLSIFAMIIKFDALFSIFSDFSKQLLIFIKKLKFLVETLSRAYFRYKKYTLNNASKFSM